MFPNLQFLALNDNHLFATPADPADESKGGRPARLPTRWTQSTYPIAFPALSGLTLWPGNEYICFLPHLTATFVDGFADVNPGGRLRLGSGVPAWLPFLLPQVQQRAHRATWRRGVGAFAAQPVL